MGLCMGFALEAFCISCFLRTAECNTRKCSLYSVDGSRFYLININLNEIKKKGKKKENKTVKVLYCVVLYLHKGNALAVLPLDALYGHCAVLAFGEMGAPFIIVVIAAAASTGGTSISTATATAAAAARGA